VGDEPTDDELTDDQLTDGEAQIRGPDRAVGAGGARG
jgi:hypothetical protein